MSHNRGLTAPMQSLILIVHPSPGGLQEKDTDMKELTISAKIGTDGKPAQVTKELGENLDELVGQYGHDVIYAHAKSSIVVAAQGKIRTLIDPEREGGALEGQALQEEMDKWTPGIRKPGKSAAEKVKEQFGKMDPELRRQLLAELAGDGGEADEAEGAIEEEQPPAQAAAGNKSGRRR
jgi:hypothetical protein